MYSLPNVQWKLYLEPRRYAKINISKIYILFFESDYYLRDGDIEKKHFCERSIDQYEQHDTSVGHNRTHNPLNTGQTLYPLSYENTWRAGSYVTGVLHSARISTVEVMASSDKDGECYAR